MKKFLLIAIMIASGIWTMGQSPTFVTPSSNCNVFRNFNTTDEDFSSPSIYGDGNDVAFFWNQAAGAEIESSGLAVRSASLISPAYIQAPSGFITVGFYFQAPPGSEYRVRIITGTTSPPLEILATTANGPVWSQLPGTSGNVCILMTDADLTFGRPIRLEFSFRAVIAGNILFDNLAASVAGGPLPVTFEGFVARRNPDESMKLLWDVGTEVNVQGYFVESSIDGVHFTNAGYVLASNKDIYSFDYPGKLLQTTFFRIRSSDYDGRSKYTPIIRVYAREQVNAPIQIYPVPAVDQVTIQHSKASDKTIITLVSPDGKVLQQKVAVPNSFQTQLDLGMLTKGIYIVKYDDGNGDVQNAKIVKN